MPLDPVDVKYLWDMLDAAERVLRYTAGMDAAGYGVDDKTQSAVERRVEVIGEAARQVSAATRLALPEIAWSAIVGTRHILAHEYGTIDQSTMWRIASVHVPSLITALQAALRDNPPPPESMKDLGTP